MKRWSVFSNFRRERLSESSQAHLNKVVRQLNERPRKAFGIETPQFDPDSDLVDPRIALDSSTKPDNHE
jgi:hypothetical protein